jgi:peptidoglycan hydrolase-like protein with peptidoglycan-binding domain
MADADLAAALKQAKSKTMFFAFIQKGSDGQLIVSKSKVTSKQIADAKKEAGGGTPVTGKCFGGEDGTLVFQVAKAAPTLGAALKKVAQRDAGVAIKPDVQVAADADAEDAGAAPPPAPAGAAGGAQKPAPAAPAPPAAAAANGPAAPAAAPAAPAAGAGDAKVTGFQKALQKLGYDPGKIDGIMGPHTEAAVKKFQQASGLKADGIIGPKTQAALAKALQGGAAAGGAPAAPAQKEAPAPAVPAPPAAAPATAPGAPEAGAPNLAAWAKAREDAIKDLKTLATKVVGTKHGSAAGVVKEINSIITKLPAKPELEEIDKLAAFIREDDTIAAAHEVPSHFHKLDIRKPLLDALQAMKKN